MIYNNIYFWHYSCFIIGTTVKYSLGVKPENTMLIMKTFSAAALGLALLSAMPAQAVPTTITNTNGTSNWTGFDWDSNGTAFTTGFVPAAGDVFTIDAFAVATTLKNGATNLSGMSLDNNADGVSAGAGFYEYTLHVKLFETVQSCTGGGLSCTFGITSGSYSIFYDTTPDANGLAGSLGTGYLDGNLLLSGIIPSQAGGTFTVAGAGGFGITSIAGLVNFTNASFISPEQHSTVASTTLQFGTLITNSWVSPGGFENTAFAPGSLVFQADANQSFSQVPEPVSLSLFGIAMLAAGMASRRRFKK